MRVHSVTRGFKSMNLSQECSGQREAFNSHSKIWQSLGYIGCVHTRGPTKEFYAKRLYEDGVPVLLYLRVFGGLRWLWFYMSYSCETRLGKISKSQRRLLNQAVNCARICWCESVHFMGVWDCTTIAFRLLNFVASGLELSAWAGSLVSSWRWLGMQKKTIVY